MNLAIPFYHGAWLFTIDQFPIEPDTFPTTWLFVQPCNRYNAFPSHSLYVSLVGDLRVGGLELILSGSCVDPVWIFGGPWWDPGGSWMDLATN